LVEEVRVPAGKILKAYQEVQRQKQELSDVQDTQAEK
jgi:hypothetical protein